MFKYVVMGAGGISNQFCDAVRQIDNCEVTAVASRKLAKAKDFAERNDIQGYYNDYEEMLIKEKPDCVYIGVTQNAHYELAMLCLKHNVGVLCEKAMFMSSKEAAEVFERSRQQKVFVMEGLWSRFLPAVKQARQWIREGRIGNPKYSHISIGFIAPEGRENRYHNKALGGGVAFDITVYAYELTVYMLEQPIAEIQVAALWEETGVDLANQITLRFPGTLASLTTTFETPIEEKMVIYGDQGYIIMPMPHMAREVFLYDREKQLAEHFTDKETGNGFVYQVKEAMECVQMNKIESKTVPHQVTLECAKLFDKIMETGVTEGVKA